MPCHQLHQLSQLEAFLIRSLHSRAPSVAALLEVNRVEQSRTESNRVFKLPSGPSMNQRHVMLRLTRTFAKKHSWMQLQRRIGRIVAAPASGSPSRNFRGAFSKRGRQQKGASEVSEALPWPSNVPKKHVLRFCQACVLVPSSSSASVLSVSPAWAELFLECYAAIRCYTFVAVAAEVAASVLAACTLYLL